MNSIVQRNYKILAYTCLVVTISALVFHFLFFWVNAIVDSYFYWAIGQYFKSGVYPYVSPFIYARPPTVSPPAYGLFLNFVQLFPKPDILLHALQLIMLGGIGFFVYKSALYFVSKSTSILAACLIILIPGNLIYSTLVLTEIGAELFISIYVYLIALFYTKKKTSALAIASSLGFAMTLWKYAFIVFGIFALVLFLLQKSKIVTSYIIIGIGLFLVLLWIKVNYDTTGAWGLSDTKAIIWNQIVMTGKILPSEDDPSMVELRKYVPNTVYIFAGLWSFQQFILPYNNNDWLVVDRILSNVAYAAIREHPVDYLKTAWNSFWQLHQPGQPYWENMWTFGDPNPYPSIQYCELLGTIQMCEPIIKGPNSLLIWNTFVRISNIFYYTAFPFIATYIFLPSFLVLLIFGKKIERTLSILYLLGTGPIAFLVQPDRRYIIPLYPIMVFIILFGIKKIHHIIFCR